ncbi:MAG TPA: BadF/BadG/BcrA/BcrD ATPase family protein [Candidatus Humimicrobiaceae bacterium]
MKCILGVDGGGTKTTVQIADVRGKAVTQVVSGASSYKSVGTSRAIENLNKAVFNAIKNLKTSKDVYFISSCFGFAGNDAEEDCKTYTEIVFNNKLGSHLDPKRTIICNDTRIGIEVGSEKKNKIIIIAGTGSNCLGINEDGKKVRASGWDYILADEGSGYSIGLKALKAVMRAYDGRGKKTMLSKTILEELNLKKVLDLVRWAYDGPFSKVMIGTLAKGVCKTAKMGDEVSINILAEEACEAAVSVITVADKLGFTSKDFDLIFAGSLFNCKEYFKNILMRRVKEDFPKVNFIPMIKNPVEGAIKLAVEKLKDS